MNKEANDKEAKSFEDAINQLEEIVKKMEEGNLSLDEALEKFESGIRLSRFCSTKLGEAESKINMLLREEDGTIIIKPADITEGNNG